MRIDRWHPRLIRTRGATRLRAGIYRVSLLGMVMIFPLSGCEAPQPAEEAALPGIPTTPGKLQIDSEFIQSGQIQVVPAARSDLSRDVSVTGRVGLDEEATVKVGSLVEGRILEIAVKVGEQVRPGRVLAQLHSREAHEVRADFIQAGADLRARQAELQYARDAAARADRLLSLKAGTLERKQRTQADLARAELAVSRAEAEVDRETEHLKHLGMEPTETPPPAASETLPSTAFGEHELVSVTSPIAGTVLERLVTLGTVVTPAEDLFVISDLSTVWVHADLPEQYLSALNRRAAVEVSVQAYPGQVFQGRVYRIADVMNTGTRTVHVVCRVPNSGRRLKSEMYATIRFGFPHAEAAVTVPGDSVQMLADESVVFVQGGDGSFERRAVRLGRRVAGRVEILSGLSVGERVVAQGSFLLKSEFLRAQFEEE